MAASDDYGEYYINIDKRWSLEDLYVFPRAFEQVYFALEAVLPARDLRTEQRITRAFRAFPWRGGYSAVNFYNQLKYATPKRERPEVLAIQYASPGFIELYLALGFATSLGLMVRSVAKTIRECNAAYSEIYRDLLKRKLLRIEVERQRIGLAEDELELVTDYSEQLAHMLQMKSAEIIHTRTGDPLVSLKILMSIYRRVRTLAEFQNRGKADFPDDDR